jgi:hypothetical protein
MEIRDIQLSMLLRNTGGSGGRSGTGHGGRRWAVEGDDGGRRRVAASGACRVRAAVEGGGGERRRVTVAWA